jgi:multiple sugar transport system substrate-binding protein
MLNEPISRRSLLAGGLKTAAVLAGASAGATLLANPALAAPRSRRANAAKTGTLTVAILGNAAANASTLKAFAAFEKATGISAKPLFINVSTWVEFFQQVDIRLAGGTSIDTMNLATEGFRLFASHGVLEPLDSYIAKDRALVNEFYSDMNPKTLADFRAHENIDGHTYFVPWGYNTMGIWYNRKIFKDANIKEPSSDWTWDEFLAAATKLTKKPQNFGMNLTIDVFQGIEPWVFTNGGQVLNEPWTKCIINNPAAVEAVTFARDLVTKGIAPAPGGTYNQFVAFSQGHLGMFGAGIWPYNTFVNNGGLANFAIAPWPMKTQHGSPVGLAAFPILAKSELKDEAWEFVKYSMTPAFQHELAVPIEGGMPMRTSVALSKSFLKTLPPGAEYFNTALSTATSVVGVNNASTVEAEIDTVWEQILTGGVSPADGLAQLEAKANADIAAKS